jgi:Ca-activated chloride channel homolog
MKIVSTLLGAFVLVLSIITSSQAAERTIIVLDASGSMWAQIEGKSRIEIAKQTVKTVIGNLPADMELGLMAYGHRDKGSCTDIELLVPPAAGTVAAIIAATNKISPKGKTPLTEAVKRAAGDLKYTEEKATVILVTDGLETCDADPCALGAELEKSGVDFTAHVVGFGLTEAEGKKVSCLATNTGGKYIQASDAKSLTKALTTTVLKAEAPPPPPPKPAAIEFNFIPTLVMSEGGEVVSEDAGNAYEVYQVKADGTPGDRVTTEYNRYKGKLEPGEYIVKAILGAASTEQKISIVADKVVSPIFTLNAGTTIIHPRGAAGADVGNGAAVLSKYPGGSTTNYGNVKLVVPAGEQTVTVTIGNGSASETFNVAAGAVVEKDIIAGVGHVVFNAFYVEGMRVDDSGTAFTVSKAAKKIDGSRDGMGTNYGPDTKFDLPAGDYVALVEIGGTKIETPFSVKVGEAIAVNAKLNAGILAVKAPGYDGWKVLSAKPKIDGSREQFAYNFGEEWQTTLVAGDYLIVTDKKDGSGSKETPVTVKAGERMEVTVQ